MCPNVGTAMQDGKEKTMNPKVKRENGKVWIDGVAPLRWGNSRECTYAGALEAALAVTEHPVSYNDIMGLSGLAFRVRWWASAGEPNKREW